MRKRRLLKPTLFLFVSVPLLLFALFEFITSGTNAEGWGAMTLYLLAPFAAGMLVFDLLLKFALKSMTIIWLIEGFILLCLVYYWIVT